MDDLQRLLIETACERLTAQYCHFVDHGAAARVAELFTEEGIWSSPDHTMTGREAIRAGFQKRQDRTERMSRHVCCNFVAEVEDEDHASGVVYLTLYRHDGEPGPRVAPLNGPSIVGAYHDTFVRTPQGWRIAYRNFVVAFTRERA